MKYEVGDIIRRNGYNSVVIDIVEGIREHYSEEFEDNERVGLILYFVRALGEKDPFWNNEEYSFESQHSFKVREELEKIRPKYKAEKVPTWFWNGSRIYREAEILSKNK